MEENIRYWAPFVQLYDSNSHQVWQVLRPYSARESWKPLHVILASSTTPFLHSVTHCLPLQPPLWLLVTIFNEKIGKICQSLTPILIDRLCIQFFPPPSLTHISHLSTEEMLQIILSCHPITCPLDSVLSTMLQTISQDLLHFISSVINKCITSLMYWLLSR